MHDLIVRTIDQPAAGADWSFVPSNSDAVRLRSITGQLVTSATAGNRTADIATTDETGNLIARDIAPVIQQASSTLIYSWRPANSQYGTDAAQSTAAGGSGVPAAGVSKSATGTVTSVTAGAAICTLAAPGAGTYTIQVQNGFLGGSPTSATDCLNFQLQVGATVIGKLNPVPIAGTQTTGGQIFSNVVVPAATAITINAIANGTAAVVYAAGLTATPAAVGTVGAMAAGSIPGFWLPNAAKVASVTANLAAGDQWSALVATFEVYDALALQRLDAILREHFATYE